MKQQAKVIAIPIRLPVDVTQDVEIEIPIRIMLVVSLYNTRRLQERLLLPDGIPVPITTKRQNSVLHGILAMKSNKEIADENNISVRTAKFHVSELLRIFGVASRMQLREKVLGKVHKEEV